jgi:F-box and WD-40 domain protein 1/11
MVWSLKTGKVLGTFAGPHTGSVLCLKFEKDWDLESPLSSPPTRRRPWNTGAQLANTGVNRNKGLGEGGEGLEYSGIKTGFMFTGSSDCTICVWHLETGDFLDNGLERVGVGKDDDRDRRVLAEPIAVLRGHAGGVLDIRIDKRWIVSWWVFVFCCYIGIIAHACLSVARKILLFVSGTGRHWNHIGC